MNSLPFERRVQAVALLVEGMSMRAVARTVGVSINTVTRLLAGVGAACSDYQDRTMRDLRLTNIQVDQLPAFTDATQKNTPADADPTLGLGDCFTYAALDHETKLLPCYMLGYRTRECAEAFMADLASRLEQPVQLTTDGSGVYVAAVEARFAGDVASADLNKSIEVDPADREAKRRHSPAESIGCEETLRIDISRGDQIATLHGGRANLAERMGMRRSTRLSNASNMKFQMHMAAVSLHFMHYNFARLAKTLNATPAMQAGIASGVWSIEEIVRLWPEPVATKRGHYKARTTA